MSGAIAGQMVPEHLLYHHFYFGSSRNNNVLTGGGKNITGETVHIRATETERNGLEGWDGAETVT